MRGPDGVRGYVETPARSERAGATGARVSRSSGEKRFPFPISTASRLRERRRRGNPSSSRPSSRAPRAAPTVIPTAVAASGPSKMTGVGSTRPDGPPSGRGSGVKWAVWGVL